MELYRTGINRGAAQFKRDFVWFVVAMIINADFYMCVSFTSVTSHHSQVG